MRYVYFAATVTVLAFVAPMNVGAADLSYGMSGNDVHELQSFLYESGYLSVVPTGYFGVITADALRAFQKDKNLNVTGAYDSKTADAVNVVRNPVVDTKKTTSGKSSKKDKVTEAKFDCDLSQRKQIQNNDSISDRVRKSQIKKFDDKCRTITVDEMDSEMEELYERVLDMIDMVKDVQENPGWTRPPYNNGKNKIRTKSRADFFAKVNREYKKIVSKYEDLGGSKYDLPEVSF